jgi:hypothetical protein
VAGYNGQLVVTTGQVIGVDDLQQALCKTRRASALTSSPEITTE